VKGSAGAPYTVKPNSLNMAGAVAFQFWDLAVYTWLRLAGQSGHKGDCCVDTGVSGCNLIVIPTQMLNLHATYVQQQQSYMYAAS